MVEFCMGIITVEALELVRVFFSGKKLHETVDSKEQYSKPLWCLWGCVQWDCGMADVGRIQFILFPANTCMKIMLGFGLELQACVCK